jgi:mono/diheme cytochrome c family protein
MPLSQLPVPCRDKPNVDPPDGEDERLGEGILMKMRKLAGLLAIMALLLFMALPALSWAAEDGAALYKATCAACHKPDASGNPAVKAPAVKGKTVADVKKAINDPKHVTVKNKHLTEEQVKAIGDYLKGLK